MREVEDFVVELITSPGSNSVDIALACNNSLSSQGKLAVFQSMISANGNIHPLARTTGIQAAWRDSRKRNEPNLLPLGTMQKVEL